MKKTIFLFFNLQSLIILCFWMIAGFSAEIWGACNCVDIVKCPPLHQILLNESSTDENKEFVKKSLCGPQDDTPRVCCETTTNSCTTKDGRVGECAKPSTCITSIIKTLKDDVSKEVSDCFTMTGEPGLCCATLAPSPPTEETEPANAQNKFKENLKMFREPCKLSAEPPAISTGCCGRDSSGRDKIAGGNLPAIDQYPWLALIEYKPTDSDKIDVNQCGGVLISGRHVLTAAHCVAGRVLTVFTPVNVRLGEYNISNYGPDCTSLDGFDDCTTGIVVIPIEKSTPHPEWQYNTGNKWHDIAIIKMTEAAPYNDFIRPICLPARDVTASPPNDFVLYTAGWGAVNRSLAVSDVKRHVNLPYSTLEVCQKQYNEGSKKLLLWEGQLCAGGVERKDSCQGDSGGPLMMYSEEPVTELVGILSFGRNCIGGEGAPDVYTKVFAYSDWIRSNMID